MRHAVHHKRRTRSQDDVPRAGPTSQQIGAHDSGHLGGPVTVVEQEEDLPAPLRLDAVGQVGHNRPHPGVRAHQSQQGGPAEGVEVGGHVPGRPRVSHRAPGDGGTTGQVHSPTAAVKDRNDLNRLPALTGTGVGWRLIEAHFLDPAAGAQVRRGRAHLVQDPAQRLTDRLQARPGLGGRCPDGAAEAVDERPAGVT